MPDAQRRCLREQGCRERPPFECGQVHAFEVDVVEQPQRVEAELLDPLRAFEDLLVGEADLGQVDTDLDVALSHRNPARPAATAQAARAAQQCRATSTLLLQGRRSALTAARPLSYACPSVRRLPDSPRGSTRS